jgi:hypothetical protein
MGSTGIGETDAGLREQTPMNESAAWRKIELHVHLEGTIDAGMLLRLARRNGVALPSQSEPELRGWMGFPTWSTLSMSGSS